MRVNAFDPVLQTAPAIRWSMRPAGPRTWINAVTTSPTARTTRTVATMATARCSASARRASTTRTARPASIAAEHTTPACPSSQEAAPSASRRQCHSDRCNIVCASCSDGDCEAGQFCTAQGACIDLRSKWRRVPAGPRVSERRLRARPLRRALRRRRGLWLDIVLRWRSDVSGQAHRQSALLRRSCMRVGALLARILRRVRRGRSLRLESVLLSARHVRVQEGHRPNLSA